jgi:CDP-diacylglycerol--glycerol-3-phosphate 3-phosphatidyltransferase
VTPVNLPNTITSVRVALTPVVAVLLLHPSLNSRLLAFLVFLLAALSDLWDGQLARRRDQITDFGKIVDPVADKLLILATVLPLYWIGLQEPELLSIPWYGGLPLWVVVVLLGREIVITTLRFAAVRRGSVVPASLIGKRKAFTQNIYVGSAMLLVALRTAAVPNAWSSSFWYAFQAVNEWFTTGILTVALLLTVISLVTYLTSFGRIFAGQQA